MEVNTQNIQQLAVYLQQTLSPQSEVRKPAEEFLQKIECNQNYPVLLLSLLQSDGADLNIKVNCDAVPGRSSVICKQQTDGTKCNAVFIMY